MARKTKAETLAEQKLAQEAMMVELAKTYPARLMLALELAQKFDMTIKVADSKFYVEQHTSTASTGYAAFEMAYEFSRDSEFDLQFLEERIVMRQKELDEEVRVYQAKQAALAKLTAEERKLLKL
jgi:hypothetical protein